MITVQVLTRNNEKTIGKTLRSLEPLEARLVVGDLGSSDATKDICREFGAELRSIGWRFDYSAARNDLMDVSGMNLMVEPWEVLVRGHDEILSSENNSNITVVRGGSASRELRLWKGLSFRNPVYEVVEDDGAGFLEGAALVASGWPDRRLEAAEICLKWREGRPTSAEPWYYSAFTGLSLGRTEDFLSFSEKYLALSGKFGPAEVQVSYRMAQVLASRGQFSKAATHAARCLATNPEFAEFWCLFGDLFFKQKMYEKAKSMYTNAMTIGRRRARHDSHPVEIDKYGRYPEAMMKAMEEMDKNTGVIVPRGL